MLFLLGQEGVLVLPVWKEGAAAKSYGLGAGGKVGDRHLSTSLLSHLGLRSCLSGDAQLP